MLKILVSTSLLSPYRVDWLNELGKTEDVTVLFLQNSDNQRETEWLKRSRLNCKCKLMKGVSFPKIGKISLDFIEEIRHKKNKYDVIIIDGYGYATQLINLIYLNIKKFPYYVNIDGIVSKQHESKVLHSIKKKLFHNFTYCLCGSKTTVDLLEHYGIKRERIIIHPFTSLHNNDIASEIVSINERTALRKKLQIKEKYMIISVGRFTYLHGYGKGYDVLLKSAKQLSSEIGWYIIGGKPTEEFIMIKEENGLDNVHFVDFLDKNSLNEYYRAADIFVLMTIGDVWGLVVNEAMACGLPIIVSNKCVAGLELVENGNNGFIVPVGDDATLCKRVQQILSNDLYRLQMCKTSLHKIASYTIENMAKIHVNAMKINLENKD